MTRFHTQTVGELSELLAHETGEKLQRLIAQLAEDPRPGVRKAIAAALTREQAVRRENDRLGRLYRLERELRSEGYVLVAGVDEVGRGALAGPLTAGACILPPSPRIRELDDSKRLSPAKREHIAECIRGTAMCHAVAHIPADQIDSIGVTEALRRAMGQAVAALTLSHDHVVVDGRPVGVFTPETAVIRGDARVAAIAAASVLAKVERDALMRAFSTTHPGYGFEVNKGYGTAEHMAAIRTLGPSPIHRRSFLPCRGTASLF